MEGYMEFHDKYFTKEELEKKYKELDKKYDKIN